MIKPCQGVNNSYPLFAEAVIGFDRQAYDVTESVGFVTVNVSVIQGSLGRDIVVALQTSNDTAVCK